MSAYLRCTFYLSAPWLFEHVLLSDMLFLTSLIPLLSFFSSTRQPPGKPVSGSGMHCEWSPKQTPDRLYILHRYSAYTLWNVYFHCDFFSPLAPFLCLTWIPSLNQYGWLDNFTGLLTPKGSPERENLTLCCSVHSVWSPSKTLI